MGNHKGPKVVLSAFREGNSPLNAIRSVQRGSRSFKSAGLNLVKFLLGSAVLLNNLQGSTCAVYGHTCVLLKASGHRF